LGFTKMVFSLLKRNLRGDMPDATNGLTITDIRVYISHVLDSLHEDILTNSTFGLLSITISVLEISFISLSDHLLLL